jgi:hypothetical protein
MKRIGFLSFGHYQPVPGSLVRTARDALIQTIELAVAAEELGIDGAFIRFGKSYVGEPEEAERLRRDLGSRELGTDSARLADRRYHRGHKRKRLKHYPDDQKANAA